MSASNTAAGIRKKRASDAIKNAVRGSSSIQYESKWKQFCAFCRDPRIQEENGTLDPEAPGQPSEAIVGKVIEFFYYKVVEKGCSPGEAINIRTALASVYRRRFGREGPWSVNANGSTDGNPMNSLVISEALQYYKREKKRVGSKSALPFRYKYMKRFLEYSLKYEDLRSHYVMGATSLCFTLWLRIEELVKLEWRDIRMGETNESGVPYLEIVLRERKYNRVQNGQKYAVYEQKEEPAGCAFTHLRIWIAEYQEQLKRDLIPSDPLFPRTDDQITRLEFGQRMNHQTFMRTVNEWVSSCGLMPRNHRGEQMGLFTAHCFRRGGAQHRFITGKVKWPFHVVKWWGGWGNGDDVNTIMKYLLEETSRYENSYSHYLYTGASDMSVFNIADGSTKHVSNEIAHLKVMVSQLNRKISQMEQTASAFRLFFAEQLKCTSENLKISLKSSINECMKKFGEEYGITTPLHNVQVGDESPEEHGNEKDISNEEQIPEDHIRDKCTHIPRVNSWREVVDHWTVGDASKNLTIPLKNWTRAARKSKFKSIFHDRKLIGEEFERVGKKEFLERYKPDEISITELKKAIRRTRGV